MKTSNRYLKKAARSFLDKKGKIVGLVAITLLLLAGSMVLNCKGKQSDEGISDKGYYTCSMHPQVISQKPGKCPICGMDLVFQEVSGEQGEGGHNHNEPHNQGKMEDGHSEKIYVCPMHPEITREEPGTCPICGMDLVLHQPSEHSGGNDLYRFRVANRLLANSNLLTVPAENREFVKKNRYSAHVDYNEDPDRLVLINSKFEGWVEKLYISKEGDLVKKGARLAGVYSPVMVAAKEEYLVTYKSLKNLYTEQGKDLAALKKEPVLAASRQKLLYLDIPPQEIARIERDMEVDRLTWFYAPITGVVVKKNLLQGTHITPGAELFRIADLSRLWVFIHIYENDLSLVKKGQRVEVRTSAYPETPFYGNIDLIYPFLDQKTRDIKVRIEIPNSGQKLKPGMFAEVEVMNNFTGSGVVIPDSAVIYSGKESYLFVSLGQGNFEIRPVVVRTSSDGYSLVTKGLQPGELVVVNGQFLLDAESSLKEAFVKTGAAVHQH